MKSLLFLLSIIFLTSCETNNKNQNVADSHIFKKAYYLTGQLKELISLTPDSIRDGLTKYYDSLGKVDSTENYIKGKLNGISTFYGLDRKIEYKYVNDTLYSLRLFDTLGNLKYQNPIDSNLLEKPFIKLKSGRDYLPIDSSDILEIFTNGIPLYNRRVTFSGVSSIRLNDNTFRVSTSKKSIKKNKIMKIVISYVDDMEEEPAKPIIYDSVLVPIK